MKHSFLQQENRLLTDRVTLLQRSAMAKDDVIQSQQEQIAMLNKIAVKHSAMANNLNAQLEVERRKRKKYVMIGGGIGAVAMGVFVSVLR